MHLSSLIEKKRDGGRLTRSEIEAIIAGFTGGDIPDYQMSALAMAIYFRGMDTEETTHLTRAMLESGESFAYPADTPRKVDKHSTGGIGDKVSLILAPLLACDDLWVPMISGRSLGITGGTLDKLECIPGFNVNLTQAEAVRQLEAIGVVMMGQTADICPADKKLYALRDVTGTVPSQPLIVASIMSKKLAESLDSLVLDVKFGSGAFMKTRGEAHSLAEAMTGVGEEMGVAVRARLNPMDEPLGNAVGNALEVLEAIRTLQGNGPADLVDLTLDLASDVSTLSREQLASRLEDGSAWKKWIAMVDHQGGDAASLDDFSAVHPAPVVRDLPAPRDGVLNRVDAGRVGRASLELGAGRQQTGDAIDYAVGFDGIRKTGSTVARGETLLRIHARTDEAAAKAKQSLLDAIEIN